MNKNLVYLLNICYTNYKKKINILHLTSVTIWTNEIKSSPPQNFSHKHTYSLFVYLALNLDMKLLLKTFTQGLLHKLVISFSLRSKVVEFRL